MRSQKNNTKLCAKPRGFTLFEVLIAITIGSVLLGIVLAIYNLTIRSLASSEARSEMTQNSRVIMDQITRDIRQARAIATVIPSNPDDPQNPPPNELEVQDGHQTEILQYVRYAVDGTDLRRQVRQYYFNADPEVLVAFDAEDDFGNPPETNLVEDEIAGQYVEAIAFYGTGLITVELTLKKSSIVHQTKTAIAGRNF